MKIREIIEENTKEFREQKKETEELRKELNKTTEEATKTNKTLEALQKKQEEYTQKLDNNITLIDQARKEFEEQIREFKIRKTSMEQQLLEKTDNEVKQQLERLKTDVNSYNELKKELTIINLTITKLDSEIKKFTDISQNIKAKDFELERYARELGKKDNEKLELMKKIDTLERLLGKERRNQPKF